MVKSRKILNKRLYRMIWSTRGQYGAILVTIILGILIYIAMTMAANNLRTTLETYYEEYNFADFFLEVNQAGPSVLTDLEKVEGVTRADGFLSSSASFVTEDPDERVNVLLRSFTGKEQVNRLILLEGREIRDPYKEVMVFKPFADARGLQTGDIITLQINGTPVEFVIAGLAASPEFIYLMESIDSLITDPAKYGAVFMDQELMQGLLGMKGSYNYIVLDYEESRIPLDQEEAFTDQVLEEIEPLLEGYGIQRIYHRRDQLSNLMIDQEIQGLKTMSSSVPVIFVLVAALILTMMLNRMVKRDRGVIGLLKAQGYSSRQIVFHYVKYSLMAGMIGGLLGGVLGMASAGGMTQVYLQYFNIPMLKASFDFRYVLAGFLMASLICTLAGLLGTRGILAILPAESMKTEAPRPGKRILLEKWKTLWKKFSFSWKLVLKNIFRTKKRTGLVIAGVVFTYGMMLFTFSMPAVIDDMMVKYFSETMKMDYSVSYKTPLDQRTVQDIKKLGDIEEAEGKTEIPVEIRYGNRSSSLNLLALSRDTVFYGFQDANGIRISLPKEGLLISENLADTLQVKEGDRVQLKPYNGKDPVTMEIAGIVNQMLGMGAYTNRDHLPVRLMDKELITGVNLKTRDPNIVNELNQAANIRSITSTSDIRATYEQSMVMIVVSITMMLIFSGILGFSIVYNVTSVNIGERETEFSTLRVLGFGNQDIFRLILKENNVITLVGILLGIPVGAAMLHYSSSSFSTEAYTIKMEPTVPAMIYAAVATIFFVVLAQGATFRKIKKLDFMQALKSRV